ncbi:MAG: hypothetical protein COB02_16410 [Candidatus Cloacimonadota bacterium]|nr:MAG: hypothetical protein COB02_16410 [Candidatus Cloacimonadota bacterium]
MEYFFRFSNKNYDLNLFLYYIKQEHYQFEKEVKDLIKAEIDLPFISVNESKLIQWLQTYQPPNEDISTIFTSIKKQYLKLYKLISKINKLPKKLRKKKLPRINFILKKISFGYQTAIQAYEPIQKSINNKQNIAKVVLLKNQNQIIESILKLMKQVNIEIKQAQKWRFRYRSSNQL